MVASSSKLAAILRNFSDRSKPSSHPKRAQIALKPPIVYACNFHRKLGRDKIKVCVSGCDR